jgi:ribonuclease T1
MSSRRWGLLAQALAFGLTLLALAPAAFARQDSQAAIALAELPPEARRTILLVRQGGPFANDRDGVVFGNFEGLLPPRERGYYREYTVPTPGVSHRGARRIVAGRGGELYYTGDHYRSFRRISE